MGNMVDWINDKAKWEIEKMEQDKIEREKPKPDKDEDPNEDWRGD